MENTEFIQESDRWLTELPAVGALLNRLACGLFCVLCLLCLCAALHKQIKRRWTAAFYIALCAFALAWGLCTLGGLFAQGPQSAQNLSRLASAAFIPLPALLCLHTQKQVSYKEPRAALVIALFAVPAFLLFVAVRDLCLPQAIGALPGGGDGWWYFPLFCLYAAFALLRSYLLCFSVFYQMPLHMRRSTRFVLLSITAAAALPVLYALRIYGAYERFAYALTVEILLPLAAPLLFILLVYALYSALCIMPASDIIVTSREFVMGGLETTVLVLGRGKQILDWNRREWAPVFALPKPRFREPYEVYRRRVLSQKGCRVSEHNENIVTTVEKEKESHFFMRVYPVGNAKRDFGFLVEISEITPVYAILRHFEGIAYYDMLTGMHNRNAYLDYVRGAVVKENMPLLIFVGDVDGLKQVNDVHGHLVGDELLTAAVNAIQSALPPGAFTARVGGDEFVVLVPNGSEDMAERFAQAVVARCMQTKHPVFGSPSISWGYAIMEDASQEYNEVFSKADAMMYTYKKGRHQFSSSGLVPRVD